jgi:hypothetical protein
MVFPLSVGRVCYHSLVSERSLYEKTYQCAIILTHLAPVQSRYGAEDPKAGENKGTCLRSEVHSNIKGGLLDKSSLMYSSNVRLTVS